jgi:thermostable 8-oxoguanine DNA glycosylase
MKLDELRGLYQVRKAAIEQQWLRGKMPKSDEEIFALLASCILSSTAKWPSVVKAMERLRAGRVLFEGAREDIREQLKGISGRYIDVDKLSGWILEARESFPWLSLIIKGIHNNQIPVTPHGLGFQALMRSQDPAQIWALLQKEGLSSEGLRELVKEIKGIGYKQASHFLASLGFENYAILDRHVLDRLVKYGVIEGKPKYLGRKEYLAIEDKMKTIMLVATGTTKHENTAALVGEGARSILVPRARDEN